MKHNECIYSVNLSDFFSNFLGESCHDNVMILGDFFQTYSKSFFFFRI